MDVNRIYQLTPAGELELRGSQTTISALEVELLVRLNGRLSMGQIQHGMGGALAAGFDQTLELLLDKGLVASCDPDIFDMSTQPVPLSSSALNDADSEAALCAEALANTQYYVRIARARQRTAVLPAGAKWSALVVDDEPHLAKFLSYFLTFEGFAVRVAGSRAEIVAELRRSPPPDLVLLDVMLPDANGFDILQRMRAHPLLKDVPVIMLTAKSSRESVLKGLAAGADGYITKPVEPEVLLKAVRTVLAG